jgi:hypothetical protein
MNHVNRSPKPAARNNGRAMWNLSLRISVTAGITGWLCQYESTSPAIHSWLNVTITVACILVVGGCAVVALRASEFYLWYGFLPILLTAPWLASVFIYQSGNDTSLFVVDCEQCLIAGVVAWLVSAGPVSATLPSPPKCRSMSKALGRRNRPRIWTQKPT